MYFVYILRNLNGLLYKGSTNDIAKRLAQHNALDGFNSYTKKHQPWTLVYSEEFATRAEATARELFFKSGRGRIALKTILQERLEQDL